MKVLYFCAFLMKQMYGTQRHKGTEKGISCFVFLENKELCVSVPLCSLNINRYYDERRNQERMRGHE